MERAANLKGGARCESYLPSELVAGLWSVYLGQPVSPDDVANLLAMARMNRKQEVQLEKEEQVPPLVDEFWRLVRQALAMGVGLDLSTNPNEYSLRMPAVKEVLLHAGWTSGQVNVVKKLLPQHSPYRLLRKNVAQHDSRTQQKFKCWVFDARAKQ